MVKPRKKKGESIDSYNKRASKEYYSNGYHISEIAQRLNIDPAEVYNYVVVSGYRITTQAEREEMISLFNKGYSYSKIAEMFGKSRACVRERIEKPAKINYDNSNEFTNKQLDKMKEMIKDGKSMEAVARELGVHVGTIRHRLKHTDMRTQYTHVSQKEIKRFIVLFKKGKTYAEIAKMCGRSRTTVCKHLNEAGYYKTK